MGKPYLLYVWCKELIAFMQDTYGHEKGSAIIYLTHCVVLRGLPAPRFLHILCPAFNFRSSRDTDLGE